MPRRSKKISTTPLSGLLVIVAVLLGLCTISSLCSWAINLFKAKPTAPAIALTATTQKTKTPRPTITHTSTPQPTRTPVGFQLTIKPTHIKTATSIPTQSPTKKPAQATTRPQATIAPTVIRPTTAPPTTAPINYDHNGDGKVTCADFSTQSEAQSAYNAGYTRLDGNDNDGRACESLP